MGSRVSASTSTRLIGAGHRSGTLHPVLLPGLLTLKALGVPVDKEVDTGPRQELVQLHVPVVASGAHVLDPDPLLHHGQHGLPVQLRPDHLIVSLGVDGVKVSPDRPGQGLLLVNLHSGSILREETYTKRAICIRAIPT